MIPAEAVEAAAKGIWEARPMERVYEEGSPDYGAAKPWADIKQYQRDRCMTLARFALEAAHPVLLAELREAREALKDAENTGWLTGFAKGYGKVAKRIDALADKWESDFPSKAADLRAAVAAANGDGQ